MKDTELEKLSIIAIVMVLFTAAIAFSTCSPSPAKDAYPLNAVVDFDDYIKGLESQKEMREENRAGHQ